MVGPSLIINLMNVISGREIDQSLWTRRRRGSRVYSLLRDDVIRALEAG